MVRLLGCIFATLVVAGAAQAQESYPSRPITLIVPFPPGGSTDVIARVVAERLRAELGQPVVIDNRGGAGGSLGTAAIAKAPPDGYTVGMGTASTLAINPATYKALPYDVLVDLAPISNLAAVPNIVSVYPGIDARDVAGLARLARAQPGKLSYASAGVGSVSHLLGEQFKLATGTDLLHVPYRGVGPALQDVVAGEVQVMFDNLPTSLPLALDGRLRPLAVSGGKRVAALPDVQTFAQASLDDLNWMAFFGIVAPARTPEAVIGRLHGAIVRVLARDDVRQQLDAQAASVVGNSPEEFAAEIRRELERMRRAVAAAGIELN
jgi:tripartite-type tricarboxylate transporter receptor subunit TctC